MLAFEISIDGGKMCTTSLSDLDVATVTTSADRELIRWRLFRRPGARRAS